MMRKILIIVLTFITCCLAPMGMIMMANGKPESILILFATNVFAAATALLATKE